MTAAGWWLVRMLVGLVGWAAVDAFGWLHGLGITAAVVLLALGRVDTTVVVPHQTRHDAGHNP